MSHINGQILNPWGLEGMSLQLLHAYIRTDPHASGDPTDGVEGANIKTKGTWQYVAIANPRKTTGGIGSTGLFAADGSRVTDATLIVRKQQDIVLTVPASALTHVDLSKAQFQVDVMSAAEDGEGVNNIRPVISCDSGTQEWRFCGGLGSLTNTTPFDSDTSDPNVIKALLPSNVKAADALSAKGALLPFVALDTPPQPTPTPTTPATPTTPGANPGGQQSHGDGSNASGHSSAAGINDSASRAHIKNLSNTGTNITAILMTISTLLAAGFTALGLVKRKQNGR